MFPSGMDYARETTGGVAGSVLIPTRFVWPYGGRSVYLCGSFTGWSERWPMTPVEGCSTVFQTICSLPPGYHQYKFIVDGEWRHDELQTFVSGNYGIVNTVLLARESHYIPAIPSPQMASGSNMDVDNEAFQRLVRVSDGTLHEVLPRISEADLEVSRHRVSLFLSTHRAYELLPESGKVIALDVDLAVRQAFHILHEQGITMAPLWDFCKRQFVGVLSALDFILIMRELGNHGSSLTEEELETHTISAWKEAKLYLNRHVNDQGRAVARELVYAGPDETLKDVALKILQNEVATVPIIHSSSENGSFPQLLHLTCLSGVLKCICRYFRHSSGSLPILQLPICAIPLGTWVPKIGEPNRQPLAMLRPSASLKSALNLLIQAQVSSIPIVDDNDSLLDVYSRSDITALAKDKVYTHINLEEMSIHQALQLGQEPYSPHGFSSQRCHMCLRSDPLHKVMERLAKPGVRRLIVVETGSKRVEGIISLSDVFRFLLDRETVIGDDRERERDGGTNRGGTKGSSWKQVCAAPFCTPSFPLSAQVGSPWTQMGLTSINPDLVELAVKNAKRTVNASGASNSGRTVRHVDSFGDSQDSSEDEKVEKFESKNKKAKNKKNKNKKKNKKQKLLGDTGNATVNKPKKKLKF
ncbi:hypothetical protein F0562_000232 [Nyssa sinensis]|uniref:CBS domain-containing protein n=1 Tax=Nyssa sinensis TaxID=561372 RepID=A0A5J5C4H4_9ASTE|nr:hypothetical protein F0562_000232 [Nyssa sinensis]